GSVTRRDPAGGGGDEGAELAGFEDLGFCAVAQDVSDEPAGVGDAEPHDDTAVVLLLDRPLLTDPPRDPGRVPDDGLDFLGGTVDPATPDIFRGIEVGRQFEGFVEAPRLDDAVLAEEADAVPARAVGDHVPRAIGPGDGVGADHACFGFARTGDDVADPAPPV